ncbi:MAG TPA: bifunctional ornithine acetyltransferase/N-acetylglutamate synthase, partial [Armatimonadota bacterium]|nr:bifunctional ornithine acetyltransferase/N-acetylglutamate synthase [Armatimonadota bacterium]
TGTRFHVGQEIDLRLAEGEGKAVVWTCDFSYDYVRINADYTT